MKLAVFLFGVAALAGTVHSSMYCNLYNGNGCSNSPGFTFLNGGTTLTPNSLCNKNYQVSVRLPSNANGFYCYFYMDVPEQYRYVYSMSQSASSSSSASTFIYGRGKDANINVRNIGSSSSYNYLNRMRWKNTHSHSDDNKYSWIRWTLRNNKVSMYSSSGDSMNMGHSYFMRPTSSIGSSSSAIRLGLNRHNNVGSTGSGLCRAYCRFSYNSFFGVSSVTNIRGRSGESPSGRSGGDSAPLTGEDPDGKNAPSLEDLDELEKKATK